MYYFQQSSEKLKKAAYLRHTLSECAFYVNNAADSRSRLSGRLAVRDPPVKNH